MWSSLLRVCTNEKHRQTLERGKSCQSVSRINQQIDISSVQYCVENCLFFLFSFNHMNEIVRDNEATSMTLWKEVNGVNPSLFFLRDSSDSILLTLCAIRGLRHLHFLLQLMMKAIYRGRMIRFRIQFLVRIIEVNNNLWWVSIFCISKNCNFVGLTSSHCYCKCYCY